MPEGWRSEKKKLPREVAYRFADYISEEMDPNVEWHFGGSYRRGAPVVGDLDIVVVTDSGRLDGDLFTPEVALPKGIVWQRGRKHARFGDLTRPGSARCISTSGLANPTSVAHSFGT
jgi:hypothetical protein